MSALQGQTGHDSPSDRRAELERMMPNLESQVESMDAYEQRFVTDIRDNLDGNEEWAPTPRQLFKARDINTKY